jgi:hypothetical protein
MGVGTPAVGIIELLKGAGLRRSPSKRGVPQSAPEAVPVAIASGALVTGLYAPQEEV